MRENWADNIGEALGRSEFHVSTFLLASSTWLQVQFIDNLIKEESCAGQPSVPGY